MKRSTFLCMIIASSFATVVSADDSLELKHIRLRPDFKEHLQQLFPSSRPTVTIQAASTGAEVSSVNTPSPSIGDGQDSLLYDQIHQWMDGKYQAIGDQQANQITALNQQFNAGTMNYSGFTWQKPFGTFSLFANRQIMPDYMHKGEWTVVDTMTINIDASTFLGKLNDAGVVDMNESEIAAFAGITFTRVYTSYHNAPSYNDGLRSDYTTLFLPFLSYGPKAVWKMEEGSVIKREDAWTIGAGGLIESPAWYGMSFSAGALAQTTNTSTLVVQHLRHDEVSPQRPGEALRISHASAQTKSAGVTAGLQLDFFKLLKFTLLSYDLDFQAESKSTFTLSFSDKDEGALNGMDDTSLEFAALLRRNIPKVTWLEPHVVELDENSSSSSDAKTMLLLWGKLKKNSFEQVRVIKDRAVKLFYRDHEESMSIIQNFWSRILSSFFFRIFNFRSNVANQVSSTRQIDMEYEATLPQSGDPAHMQIERAEQFSFSVAFSYQAARTDRNQDKSYRDEALRFMENWTSLPGDLRTMVRNNQLRGPLALVTKLRVMGDGLARFHSLDIQTVQSAFQDACGGNTKCAKELMSSYLTYMKILIGTGRLELAQLKKMLQGMLKSMKNMGPMRTLFGEFAFVNGTFNAVSSVGTPFTTTFSDGMFRGLGVIDNYHRLDGIRAPATVLE